MKDFSWRYNSGLYCKVYSITGANAAAGKKYRIFSLLRSNPEIKFSRLAFCSSVFIFFYLFHFIFTLFSFYPHFLKLYFSQKRLKIPSLLSLILRITAHKEKCGLKVQIWQGNVSQLKRLFNCSGENWFWFDRVMTVCKSHFALSDIWVKLFNQTS